MKRFISKPYVWAVIFSLLLTGATVFILLDTFVLLKIALDALLGADRGDALTLDFSDPDWKSALPEDADDDTIARFEKMVKDGYIRYYKDNNIEIKLLNERIFDTEVYSADITVSDPVLLKTAFSKDDTGYPVYGLHVEQHLSEIASGSGAILAVNGDYYGFRDKGFVIKNGVLYRDISCSEEALIIGGDGAFGYYLEDETDANELSRNGAWQSFSFGPVLVRSGEIAVGVDAKVEKEYHEWDSNPRTALGMVSPGHYIFTVSDGRTEASAGLSLYNLAAYMDSLGCTEAYNLDGGGTTEMWFCGEVINHPTHNGQDMEERGMSDIVYIGYFN